MPRGWHKHPKEHGLAAKGIKTRNAKVQPSTPLYRPYKPPSKELSSPKPKLEEPAEKINKSSTNILNSAKNNEPKNIPNETQKIKNEIEKGKDYNIDRDWFKGPHKDKSLMYIYENAPRIRYEAIKSLRFLDANRSKIDPYLYDVAKHAYQVLISLSYAMEDSVVNGKLVKNPYQDKKLNEDISHLQSSVKRWKYASNR